MDVLMARISSILILLSFAAVATAGAQTLKYNYKHVYGSFNNDNESFYRDICQFKADAIFNNDALQVNPDTGATAVLYRFNDSGRVLLKRPSKLWDRILNPDNTSRVVGFNTSFSVNIYPLDNHTVVGEGLSFVNAIAPNLDMPLKRHGGLVSLTNASTDGNVTNRIIFVNDYAPRRRNLTVGYLFSNKKRISLEVGILVVVILLAAMVALGYYKHKRRKVARSQSNILSQLNTLPWMPREFKYKELKKATNNFDEKRKLGQGGFGVVYRGVLPEEGSEIAVKCFSREGLNGETDFLAELTIINRLRHKHLVRLLGWCHKNGKLQLVYEYMPKGSLDMHLFAAQNTVPLSWILRYKIISGVASALNYLHYEYDQKVIHRDIKASNIMLDSNFNARLGDFGLARALDDEKTSYAEAEGVLGTIGYVAPEYLHTGKATQHSDVYAFGAVLMEVVCGQRPGMKIGGFQCLVDWVWSVYHEGHILDAVDKRLMDDFEAEEAERLLLLGLACSHPIASERPKTIVIMQIISGSVPVPNVPPFKPAFVWPAMMPIGDLTEVTSIDTTSLSKSHIGSHRTPYYLNEENSSGYTDCSTVYISF